MQEPRKVALVTGASSGIGAAIARALAKAGYRVFGASRHPGASSDEIETIVMDVDDDASVASAVAAVMQRAGRLDAVINNAGWALMGPIEETSIAEARAQMETNFFGAVAVTRAALPHMRSRRAGAVVNISSLGGQLSYAGFGAYSASKFALEGLSEALALEMAPFGIKVLIVEPGAFRTRFAGGALRHMPAIDAYRDVVGGVRAFARGMDGTQEGDPDKAARAVAQALAAETTPLRLQLGADAVAAVRGHAERLLADLASWEATALDTRVDGAAS